MRLEETFLYNVTAVGVTIAVPIGVTIAFTVAVAVAVTIAVTVAATVAVTIGMTIAVPVGLTAAFASVLAALVSHPTSSFDLPTVHPAGYLLLLPLLGESAESFNDWSVARASTQIPCDITQYNLNFPVITIIYII